MKIDDKTINHLAALSKIELSTQEKKSIKKELSDILEFVEQLNELKTDDVPETSQVTGLQNVMRSDEANYDFAKEDIHPTMPYVDENGFLKVHAVFTGDSPSN